MKVGEYVDAWLEYGWPPGILGHAIYRWWQRRKAKRSKHERSR